MISYNCSFARTAVHVLCCSIFLLATCSTASAGLVLSFGTSTPSPIVVGSTATLDVFVRADTGTQLLDGFFLNLKITGTGVVFPIAQPNSQLTSNTPVYVFQNRSLSFRTNTDVGVGDAASNYFGFDSSDDGSGPPLAPGNPSPVSLNSTNNLLLARVNLTGVIAGTYSIDVDALSSSFFTNQLDPSNTLITFTSTAGNVTVINAVPEPKSILLVAICVGGVALRRRFSLRFANRHKLLYM